MSTSVSLPTLLESDFYGFAEQLTDQERESIGRVREYLETEVTPIVNDYWARAEFPMRSSRASPTSACSGAGVPLGRQFENSAVFRGWVALELGRIDASVATLVGVQNGLAMGSIGVGGTDEQRAEWLPRMAAGELVGASA